MMLAAISGYFFHLLQEHLDRWDQLDHLAIQGQEVRESKSKYYLIERSLLVSIIGMNNIFHYLVESLFFV